MANYVLGIVAHIARKVQYQKLTDEVKPQVVTVDDGSLGATGNHLSVLRECVFQAAASGSEWTVVLEDDAVPVAGFHRQLSAALDVAPSHVVSLYNGTGYPTQRQHQFKAGTHRQDVCWLTNPHLRHAVAYAIHHEAFELGLLDTVERYAGENYAPDDAISKWCMRYSRRVAYANPSLVDHEDGPSVIKTRRHLGIVTAPQRRRPRVAHWAGTRLTWDQTCLDIA